LEKTKAKTKNNKENKEKWVVESIPSFLFRGKNKFSTKRECSACHFSTYDIKQEAPVARVPKSSSYRSTGRLPQQPHSNPKAKQSVIKSTRLAIPISM
jgi:hypothetical protein